MTSEHGFDSEYARPIRLDGHQFQMHVASDVSAHDTSSECAAHTARLLSKMCHRAAIFIDVGARYGFYSMLAASQCPHLQVISLEPVRQDFEILEQNVALNGLKNIEAHNLAASDGEAERISIPGVGDCRGETVKVTTIDALMSSASTGPIIVKIDVGGHELAVLNGMSQTLAQFTDLALFVTFNPTMIKQAGGEAGGLLRKLDELGFAVILLDDVRRQHFRIRSQTDWSALVDAHECVSLVCLRKECALSVLYISHASDLTGAERSLAGLVDELISDYWALATVVCPAEGPLAGELLKVGASVVISPYEWWCEGGQLPSTINRRVAQSCRSVAEELPFFRKVDPDLIWTQSIAVPWGAMVATLLGKPHIWAICEYGEKDHNFRFILPFQNVLRAVDLSSNFVFTNSPSLLHELFPQLGPERGDFLYRHIQIPDRKELKYSEPFWSGERAFRVAIFGTIHEGKGQKDLVCALRILKERGHRDVELLIAGHAQAEYLAQLRSLTDELSITDSVIFTGFIEDPYPIMAMADVVVNCSRSEAFGRTVVEAMLLRRAIVYAGAGGPLDYMTDGVTGLAYSPGDPESLADQIEKLIRDPELQKKLGENAFSHARETFSREGYGGKAHQKMLEVRDQPPPIGSGLVNQLLLLVTDELQLVTNELQRVTKELQLMKDDLAYLQVMKDELEASLVELREETAQLRGQLQGVVQSTSWRLTAPIRVVGRKVPRLARAIHALLAPCWRLAYAVLGRPEA
jgi:FkbM family methyltransferase